MQFNILVNSGSCNMYQLCIKNKVVMCCIGFGADNPAIIQLIIK